ncbi:MAG: hypothetical protein KF802_13905 [Bdellovibrionaceae bacterium]|nr:hypothetical protein [Pseudobdellovibrionaceae bacterium]MBX3033122.1 hypothetical protein [Pseudobdellovibrionaceae bacterium]
MSLKNLCREVLLMSIVVTIISGLMASLAHAAPSAPRSLTLGLSDSDDKALGGVCHSLDVGGQALPCNPAFIARETKPNFRAQLFAGNNISYMQDVSKLLDGEGDRENMQRLFSQTRASEMEANLEGAYRRPTFGVAFSPYRLMYYSFIRNRSLPVITLLAAQEQTLRFQFAGYAGDDWSWGLQVRGVRRTFIASTFSITDAFSEDHDDILGPRQQSAVYLEPGFLKEYPDSPWRTQFTGTLSQLGAVDRKADDFPTSPELHLGSAVRPPVSLGELELGLDLAFSSQTSHWSDPFRLGASYEIGVTKVSGSAGASEHAFGFQLRYWDMTGGLTYTSRWIKNWIGEDEWVRTVYLQFGFNI